MLPPQGKVVALFLNGLPLGTVWGVVFSFLEGRRTSEILGAGLSCAYVVASGAVKSIGATLLEHGISEAWMPAVTGLAVPAGVPRRRVRPEPDPAAERRRRRRAHRSASR